MSSWWIQNVRLFVAIFVAFALARRQKSHRPEEGYEKSDIIYHKISLSPSLKEIPQLFVFAHAAVGIFHKRRGFGTWGYGEYILKELLMGIKDSGLLEKAAGVYVGLLGSEDDRMSAKLIVANYSSKANVVMEANNLYFAEFPTLLVLQNFSKVVHKDSAILYIHSKGMRNNGGGGADGALDWKNYSSSPAHYWRRYMMYFLIEHHDVCVEAIQKQGYHTCGVLKQGLPSGVYAGNYWWSTASWLRNRQSLMIYDWNMHSRMEAENMILRGVSMKEHQKHYCIHHTHHNMYDCPTHRRSYETVPLKPFRHDANCHFDRFYKNFGIAMKFPEYCFFENETFPALV
jgi:hypothetical protein